MVERALTPPGGAAAIPPRVRPPAPLRLRAPAADESNSPDQMDPLPEADTTRVWLALAVGLVAGLVAGVVVTGLLVGP